MKIIGMLLVFGLLTLFLGVSVAVAGEYDESILGMWRFDEESGDTVVDSSSNGNDGTLIRGAEWADGKFGGALEFAGAGQVEVPHSDSLNRVIDTGEVTLSAWIYPIAFGSWKGIFGKWGNGRIYSLWLHGNSFVFDIGHAVGGGETAVESQTRLDANEWYHVVGVSDGTTMKLYINGEQDPVTGDTPEMAAVQANLVIGDIDTWSFIGKIDEVVVFNKAFTEDEVIKLMGGLDEFLLAVQSMGKLAATWGEVKNSY